jgi:hypothetical protein
MISLTSSAFGPRLSLRSGTPLSELFGDVPTGSTSTISQSLPAGTYYIFAGARTPTAAGAYTLSVTATGAVICGAANSISTIIPAAGAGTTITGSLASTDCALGDGTRADVYKVSVTTTVNVDIDLTSTAFDPYLFLVSAAFGTITEDGDSGGSKNARISRTLSPGTYYIVANSLVLGAQGAYTLTVKIP